MTCFVYVIAHAKTDDVPGLPVKIGVTSKLKGRLRTLQCGNPEKVMIAGAFEFPDKAAAHRIERAVHAALDEYNLTGREWFWVEPSVARTVIRRAVRRL